MYIKSGPHSKFVALFIFFLLPDTTTATINTGIELYQFI